MSIGTKIRDLRKTRGLTQEQVAAAIGVSKPAVSKWESNNGYPDITLLAPLARFFETTVDCLLEYNISITEKQISEIIEKLQALLFTSDFEQAKKYSDSQLHQYPNIGELKLLIAQEYFQFAILDTRKYIQKSALDYSQNLLQLVSKSTDKELRENALTCIANNSLLVGEYDQALNAALQLPQDSLNTKILLATIYFQTGDLPACKKMSQEVLFLSYKNCDLCFGLLAKSSAEEGQLQNTLRLQKKHLALEQLIEIDCSGSIYLEIAETYAKLGNDTKAIHALNRYVGFLSKPFCNTRSILFDSINLDDSVGAPLEKAAFSTIADSISTNPAFVALVPNVDFQRIIEKIRVLSYDFSCQTTG